MIYGDNSKMIRWKAKRNNSLRRWHMTTHLGFTHEVSDFIYDFFFYRKFQPMVFTPDNNFYIISLGLIHKVSLNDFMYD